MPECHVIVIGLKVGASTHEGASLTLPMLAGNVSMDEGTKGKNEYEKAVSLCHCAGALQTRPQVF